MKSFIKTKLIAVLLCFALVFACAGCDFGSYTENGGKPDNSGSTAGDAGEEPVVPPEGGGEDADTSTHYIAYVFVDSQPYMFGDNSITVEWVNQANSKLRYVAALSANGVADAGAIAEGDYNVHILNLPAEFTYNPNGYKATAYDRQTYLNLTNPTKPTAGDGSGWYENAASFTALGTYRATFTEPDQAIHFYFLPTPLANEEGGYYVIRSLVDIYSDEVNPTFSYYGANRSYVMSKPTEIKRNGGPEGSYTKNFVYGVPIANEYVGNAIIFTVTAEQKYGNYPFTVDFSVTREGDAVSDDYLMIYAKQAVASADSSLPYHYADELSPYAKTFDSQYVKFNSLTGCYHVYDPMLYENNDGFGPRLYCDITKIVPSFPKTALINANAIPTDNGTISWLRIVAEFMGVTYDEKRYDENYEDVSLRCFEQYVEESHYWDFETFICNDYYNVRNSDGRVYVTRELKIFLQLYAEQLWLWSDRLFENGELGYTTPETLGYTASHDSLWMFACGYYQ